MTNKARTGHPGQPFDEGRHKHLARHLPTACWVFCTYAEDIATAYSGRDHQEQAELASLARTAADNAGGLLARMAAASREEFPAAAWLDRYSTPQPPARLQSKKRKRRPRK